MSMKIYDAYRLKEGYNIWDVSKSIHKEAIKFIQWKLTEIYREIILKNPDEDVFNLHNLVLSGIKSQKNSLERNMFDVDILVHIWYFEGTYYLRGYCDTISILNGALDFLSKREELEEYHYQNWTDKPGDISDSDWNGRFKIWDKLSEEVCLTLIICSPVNFIHIDPFISVLADISTERKKVGDDA